MPTRWSIAREVQAFAARFKPPPQLRCCPAWGISFNGRLPEVARSGHAPSDSSRASAVLRSTSGKAEEAWQASSYRASAEARAARLAQFTNRLQILQRQRAHFLAGRLRLERHLLAGERIDAFTRLGRGPLHDLQLEQTGKSEQTVAPQALLDDAVE